MKSHRFLQIPSRLTNVQLTTASAKIAASLALAFVISATAALAEPLPVPKPPGPWGGFRNGRGLAAWRAGYGFTLRSSPPRTLDAAFHPQRAQLDRALSLHCTGLTRAPADVLTRRRRR